MSFPNHLTSNIEDTFSSNFTDYPLASPDYFSATLGNTSPNSSNDFTNYLLDILVFSPLHDDPYMEVMQAYELHIPLLQAPIALPTVVPSVLSLFGSSSPIRSITPPLDYLFDESIYAELDNSLWIIPRPLGTQAVTTENTNNTNRNTRSREALVAKRGNSKEFISCKPFYFNVLYPNMVPNSKKLMEVFIGGLPRSIEGNVTASKPQTLEEAITITKRLMEQQVLNKCSALVLRVEGLKTANTAQQLEILKLKARVKKLERLNKVKSSKLKRLKKVGTSQRIESLEDLENVFNQERINVNIDEGIEQVVDQEKDAEIEGRQADTQAEIYNIDLDHSSKVLSMQEDEAEVQEAIEIVTTAKLMTEVVTAATTQVVPTAKPAVVAVSTSISAAKPAAKPKVLKIVPAALAVSTRKRK
nr:reverse transcriptase domain-containing protein [Tanacetum cinerariifolium]